MCSGIDRKERKNLNTTSLSLSLKLTEGPVEQQQRQQKRKDQNFYKTTRLHTLKEQEVQHAKTKTPTIETLQLEEAWCNKVTTTDCVAPKQDLQQKPVIKYLSTKTEVYHNAI